LPGAAAISLSINDFAQVVRREVYPHIGALKGAGGAPENAALQDMAAPCNQNGAKSMRLHYHGAAQRPDALLWCNLAAGRIDKPLIINCLDASLRWHSSCNPLQHAGPAAPPGCEPFN
jgi:hypothetical protein